MSKNSMLLNLERINKISNAKARDWMNRAINKETDYYGVETIIASALMSIEQVTRDGKLFVKIGREFKEIDINDIYYEEENPNPQLKKYAKVIGYEND